MRIVIKQYESTPEPFDLDKDSLTALLSEFRNKIDIHPSTDGGFIARGTNYVGMIRAGNLEVVITPKIDSLSAFWMLAFTRHAIELDADFPLPPEAGLVEILIYAFAVQTQHIVRRGIYRTYVEFEDRLPYVRGRILPLEDARNQLGLRDKITCRFAELTANIPHNQILAYATRVAEKLPLRLDTTKRILAWNYVHLGEVDAVLPSVPVKEFYYNRLNDHYRRAVHLAHLIIQHVSFQLRSGKTASPSFLVDMDRVFQDYVTTVFEEQATRQGLFRSTSANYRLDTAGHISLTPDIVLRDRDGHILAVIDAKYKRFDAQADYYQALAYAKGLGVNRVALVYPADGEVLPASYAVVNDDVEILVRTVPVGHAGTSFGKLESLLRKTVGSILDELMLADGVRI